MAFRSLFFSFPVLTEHQKTKASRLEMNRAIVLVCFGTSRQSRIVRMGPGILSLPMSIFFCTEMSRLHLRVVIMSE